MNEDVAKGDYVSVISDPTCRLKVGPRELGQCLADDFELPLNTRSQESITLVVREGLPAVKPTIRLPACSIS